VQDSNNSLVKPARDRRDDEKFEVGVEITQNQPEVVIRQLTWADGLGWCAQKTVRIPADRLQELRGSLTVASHQIARQKSEAGDFEPAKVLQFPQAS
jgi:hypothetical protein